MNDSLPSSAVGEIGWLPWKAQASRTANGLRGVIGDDNKPCCHLSEAEMLTPGFVAQPPGPRLTLPNLQSQEYRGYEKKDIVSNMQVENLIIG